MEIAKAKKIGLFTAISIMVASVIGIGIFLKNLGVFNLNDNNAIGVLLSWGIGTIVALTTAYSFAEISTSSKSNAGLGRWAQKLLGNKFGYFVKFNLPTFYFSLLSVILTLFLGETFFVVIGVEGIHFAWIAVLSLGMGIFIYLLNYVSIKVAGRISVFANVAKFAPIVGIILVGIILSMVRGEGGHFDTSAPDSKPINFTGILAAIPSVLFAFDSFLVVGNIAQEVIKPKRNVPIAIVAGMIFVGVVYILITIAQLLASNGNALTFFTVIFGIELDSLTTIMNIIIFIAVYGVNNSFGAGIIRVHGILINEKSIFYHNAADNAANFIFKEKKNENSAGLLSAIGFYFFYWIIIWIPSVARGTNGLGNDHYIDWISNFPTLFFFLVYGLVILGGVINRFTNKVEVTKFRGFLPVGIISFVLIIFVFGYQFFYANIAEPIMDPFALKTSLGLFHGGSGAIMTNLEGALIFLAFLGWFVAAPFINLGIMKLTKQDITGIWKQ